MQRRPLLFFFLVMSLFGLLRAEECTLYPLPPYDDFLLPECDCISVICEVSVSRAIALADKKRRLTESLEEPSPATVFDAPIPDYDCTAMIEGVNVERALAVTEWKFRLGEVRGWLESGMEYVDTFHAELTRTVHIFSANADMQLASWSGSEWAEKKRENNPRDGNASAGLSDYFNQLFLDDTYLYGSEASYLIVSIGMELNKEEGTDFLNKVRFAIKLPYTQKQLQLFVGDPAEDDDDAPPIVDEEGRINNKTAVGARYFVPEFLDNLKASATAGFRGIINPFVMGRVEYPVNYYDWLIRPVQYVEYSRSNKMYEKTELYFDRKTSKSEMVRLQLRRSTETDKVGMQYMSSFSYYKTYGHKTGLRTYISMTGRTKVDTHGKTDDDEELHSGVYRYTIGSSWKASFLRKWLFYKIEPRVDFDMLYNWRPNYVARFWLEIFFGDI